MSATIQLRKGDMFAQPTDLIIIPCSTAATITGMIADRLESLDISPPRKAMNLGDVDFQLFEGAANIATYVGYAASVAAMESDLASISNIAEKVAKFAKDKAEIRDVSIPLLGSGAGGLSPEESARALIRGLERVSVKNKVYNIFVFEAEIFARLGKKILPKTSTGPAKSVSALKSKKGARSYGVAPSKGALKPREAMRVFISYTKTNVHHQEWVKELARFLREHGVDARLDVWHLRPGMDLPQWMSNELDLADRVLIVCNEEYAARADGRLGGVGWEIRLVQADLLQTQASNPKKYIPIVRGRAEKESVPRFLQGTYHVAWKDSLESNLRKDLLKELYEAFEEAPPIGAPPRYVLR